VRKESRKHRRREPPDGGGGKCKNSGRPALIHVAPEASVRQALNLMSTTTCRIWVLDAGRRGCHSEASADGAADRPAKILTAPWDVMDPPSVADASRGY